MHDFSYLEKLALSSVKLHFSLVQTLDGKSIGENVIWYIVVSLDILPVTSL